MLALNFVSSFKIDVININVILKLILDSTYLLFKNSDALIFKRFAEFDKLSTFRVDCQRRDDHVGPFVH